MELQRLTKGKIAESLVLAHLLELGLEVYESCVNTKGVDYIVRVDRGQFVEIHVQGIFTERDPAWFLVQTPNDPEEMRHRPHFVIGITTDKQYWIFPSDVFFNQTYANISTNEDGISTVDIKLDSTKRGATETNRSRLAQYQDNWKAIIDCSLNTQ